jgi:hypothetical protein
VVRHLDKRGLNLRPIIARLSVKPALGDKQSDAWPRDHKILEDDLSAPLPFTALSRAFR